MKLFKLLRLPSIFRETFQVSFIKTPIPFIKFHNLITKTWKAYHAKKFKQLQYGHSGTINFLFCVSCIVNCVWFWSFNGPAAKRGHFIDCKNSLYNLINANIALIKLILPAAGLSADRVGRFRFPTVGRFFFPGDLTVCFGTKIKGDGMAVCPASAICHAFSIINAIKKHIATVKPGL
jgi:hypothetical protein